MTSEYYKSGLKTSDYQADLAAAQALYNHFVPTFKSDDQDSLEDPMDALSNPKRSDYIDAESAFEDFSDQFRNGFADLRINSVTGKPKAAPKVVTKTNKSTKMSYISSLSVKRTASKKDIKVAGTAKLYAKANDAYIKTSKGYKYAKLSNKHSFKKTIYAPKATTVKVTVGNYSHGHFTPVTSAKTARVK